MTTSPALVSLVRKIINANTKREVENLRKDVKTIMVNLSDWQVFNDALDLLVVDAENAAEIYRKALKNGDISSVKMKMWKQKEDCVSEMLLLGYSVLDSNKVPEVKSNTTPPSVIPPSKKPFSPAVTSSTWRRKA